MGGFELLLVRSISYVGMTSPEAALEEKKQNVQTFVGSAENVGSFVEFVHAAEDDGALGTKTKELISLAIGVAVQCEDCVIWHLDGALEAGATADEVEEALTVAVVMGGGPALMYATTAHQMLQEFLEE